MAAVRYFTIVALGFACWFWIITGLASMQPLLAVHFMILVAAAVLTYLKFYRE